MNIRVREDRIRNSLMESGFCAQKAVDAAGEAYVMLTAAVPAKFQTELDYYLDHGKPSMTTTGRRLKRLMFLHNGNFFDALCTLAVGEE